VQYAAQAGANVLATARPGADADFVRDLGAHEVIDYAGDLTAQVRAVASEAVAVVFHLAGDPEDVTSLLTSWGHIVSTLGYGAEQNGAAVAVMANPDTSTLGRLADDVLAGRLRVPIERTFPICRGGSRLSCVWRRHAREGGNLRTLTLFAPTTPNRFITLLPRQAPASRAGRRRRT
jgi:NADPH:quinone reductase-like Zn-dependent oxidoreductase